MNARTLFALAALVLSGCSTMGPGSQSTERFNQKAPQPGAEWKGEQGTWQGKHPAAQFNHVSNGDVVISAMLDSMDDFPASDFRHATDGELSKGCSTWTSQSLDETPSGGYPRQIWFTQCDRDGTSYPTLHLYITGKNAGYYVFYQWKERPDAATVEKWAGYMRELYVCDDKPGRGTPCPAPAPGTITATGA